MTVPNFMEIDSITRQRSTRIRTSKLQQIQANQRQWQLIMVISTNYQISTHIVFFSIYLTIFRQSIHYTFNSYAVIMHFNIDYLAKKKCIFFS